ncbi:MAG: hypothetical protein AB8G99_00245, partial [Planctomycetaceae bacterium]
KVAADPRRGSDVYQLKAHTIDGQIEAAKTVAPNAHYRKRSDRMIVDGSGAELAKVQELFKKFGVAPVSQQRMDATPSRPGRLKAAELRPVSQVKGEFARTEGSDFADVYKFSKLEPFEVLERVKAKFPTVRATVNGSRLVVLGDLGQRKSVENEIKRIDPKVEQDEVPVRTPMPSRSTPATASAHRPPRFVTGRLSQDGESIMVLDPSVAKPRLGTYRVRRPYTEIAKDENGDNKRVTKFLTETHTPWVEQKNATEPRTVYKRANIKITTVGRVPIPAADLATAFDGKRPVILLRGEQQISPLYQKVLRPGIAVIIVPIEEASK